MLLLFLHMFHKITNLRDKILFLKKKNDYRLLCQGERLRVNHISYTEKYNTMKQTDITLAECKYVEKAQI